METSEFSRIQLDAFREISSMAAAHAAISFSTMLGDRVDITVPNVLIEPLNTVPVFLGGPGNLTGVVSFLIGGQIKGTLLLVFSASEALKLIHVLTGEKAAGMAEVSEMGISAIKEFGNIITGSYVRVLADGLKMRISHSVPGFAYDMIGAIFDEILAHISYKAGHAIIMESKFAIKRGSYGGHLVFILAPKDLDEIIRPLGV